MGWVDANRLVSIRGLTPNHRTALMTRTCDAVALRFGQFSAMSMPPPGPTRRCLCSRLYGTAIRSYRSGTRLDIVAS